MTPNCPAYSLAAAEAARDALDQGDDALRAARTAGGPPPRRSTGLGSSITGDASLAQQSASDRLAAPHDERARLDSRRDYEAAHHHYLSAASLYYTGIARESEETPTQTIARLPGSLGNAIRSAHEDYLREVGPVAGTRVDEEAVLERTDRYLTTLRDELEAREPRVFGGRELLATETSPTR
jgi:hypothetical protein